MGCGTSSLPAEAPDGKGREFEPDSKNNLTPGEGGNDMVESFEVGTPSPSPQAKVTLEKETLESGDMPAPAAYKSDGAAECEAKQDFSSSVVSNFGSDAPLGQDRDRDMGNPLDQWQPRNAPTLSPGYKMEDEGRKIGGFDPEAFRKANQPKTQQFFSQGGVQQSTHTPPIDWSTPAANSNNGNSGYQGGGNSNPPMYNNSGGSGEQWNRRDYIQSDDIFTTESPQAYQQQPQRVDFRDDPAEDPFRAPGGLGHGGGPQGAINNEDDALMDEIINELEDF